MNWAGAAQVGVRQRTGQRGGLAPRHVKAPAHHFQFSVVRHRSDSGNELGLILVEDFNMITICTRIQQSKYIPARHQYCSRDLHRFSKGDAHSVEGLVLPRTRRGWWSGRALPEIGQASCQKAHVLLPLSNISVRTLRFANTRNF